MQDFSHPARFSFRFENRHSTAEGIAPDIKKDDFINVIYDMYDSEMDGAYPEDNHININVDVQRYYTPLLTSSVNREIDKLKKQFIQENNSFLDKVANMGFGV